MIWIIILAFIGYLIVGVLCLFSLWVKFAALFAIERVRHEGLLDSKVEIAGKVLLFRGTVFDAFCNVFFVTLLFLECPREWMVSARLQRLVLGSDGWRKRMAVWFAAKAMNPLCREPHIKLEI